MTEPPDPPEANGAAWAALLSAAIGGAAVGTATVLAECSPTAARLLQWYRPAGSLSGVAGCAVLAWAGGWAALHVRWRGKHLRRETALLVVTCGLVAAGVLATFPPVYELF